MRLENNFDNEINHENVALEADLKCSCGNKTFIIFHTGILKKGLFNSYTLREKEKQIVIKCKCSKCNKEYIIYDSMIDGVKTSKNKVSEFNHLTIKDNDKFNINLKYSFYEKNFKTDKFEMIYIDIKKEDTNKYIRIYEQ